MDSEHRKRTDITQASATSSVSEPASSSSVTAYENGKAELLGDPFKSNLEGDVVPDRESDSSPESSHTAQWSMVSASPDILSMRSPMVLPPPGYDPKRIPSSVFSTTAASQTDWSITSNESLFSIHMGKSGELFKLDDYNYSHPYERRSCELSGPLPTLMEVPAHEESSAKSSNVSPRHDKNDLFQVSSDSHDSKKMDESGNHHPSLSNARLSMESGTSATSFAFPVLTKDGSKTRSMRESFAKQEKEEAKEEQESKESTKTPVRKWFSWFSCWPRGCC